MSAGTSPASLAPGTQFTLNGRTGVCLEAIATGAIVQWEAHECPYDATITPAATDLLKAEHIGRMSARGELEIFPQTEGAEQCPELKRAHLEAFRPDSAMTMRALFKLDYVEAVDEMIAEGKLRSKPRRSDIAAEWDVIEARARRKQDNRVQRKSGKSRAGSEIKVCLPARSPRSVHDWWRRAKADRVYGLYDKYSQSGNRSQRYTTEEVKFFGDIVDQMITQERPHIASIVASVRAAVLVENDRRKKLESPEPPLSMPGRDFITSLIKRISPLDFAIRTRGRSVAYRDLHTLGEGQQLTRPLERVEIDEQTVDLVTVLRATGVSDALGPAGLARLGFDVAKARVTISAAIDCYTACLVGLQISAKPDQDFTRRTIEMIYLDKTDLAKAAGATSDWYMCGHPETLVMDKGAVFISDEKYLLLARSGITNFSLPGEHPFLKGCIEGFFRTLSSKMMSHLVGRTFKDVVAKGENDPEARALIDIDTFLRLLTRWIVDVYHNTEPSRPGKLAPASRWRRALDETPPVLRTDTRRLRMTFGIPLRRKLTRRGIQVGNVLYQSQALAQHFLSNQDRDVDLWWWDRQIGAIEVCLADGTCISVPCVDKQWEHASQCDATAYFEAARQTDPERALIAARALVDIDTEMLPMKRRLNGMLPLAPGDAELKRQEAENMRFMQTRDRARPEHRGIFDDVVETPMDGADIVHPTSANETSAIPKHSETDDYKDILE